MDDELSISQFEPEGRSLAQEVLDLKERVANLEREMVRLEQSISVLDGAVVMLQKGLLILFSESGLASKIEKAKPLKVADA